MGYYEPTHTIDLSYSVWAFDILGIDVRPDGFYLGTSVGRSCSMFWKNHTKDDFTGPLTVEQAREEALSLWENTYGADRVDLAGFMADLDEALSKEN